MTEQEDFVTPIKLSMLDIQNMTFTYEPSIYKPKNLFKFDPPLNICTKPKPKRQKLYDEIIYPENLSSKWNYYKKSKLNIFSKTTLALSALGKNKSGKTQLLLRLLEYDETLISESSLKGLGIIYPKNMVLKNVTLFELSNIFNESQYNTSNTLVQQMYNDNKINDMFINYLTCISNIILLVVNDYSFEDIQYINKIKNKISSSNKLFIVHNLKDKETINECEQYIDKLSDIFELQKLYYVLNSNHNIKGNFNKNYYREFFTREKDDAEITIVHVIYAKDNTEAGDYYNPIANSFLKAQIGSTSNLKTFNVVNTINNYLYQESLKLFNAQKIVNANRDVLELININENDVDSNVKNPQALCYLENEILTFKFQMAAIKYKLNIKIKRTKEYYFFWFKFGMLSLLKYLENNNAQPDKNTEMQIQIPTEDGDLISIKRHDFFKQGNLIAVTYKFPPNELSSDEYI